MLKLHIMYVHMISYFFVKFEVVVHVFTQSDDNQAILTGKTMGVIISETILGWKTKIQGAHLKF